ncbi:hypothetical protein [Paenibacillus sacheonensis]|uniref:Uncharacterized protein n=1 Tax=Paenibacillus sacheonensis TaxID=742054 RepID=A0A7X4YQ71_9BACL|nr:hypothetical protein [Paenibacillus sacheonensis]NBC69564.1 hypothetical protein [Paenibacillus sacheonensis]
MMSSGTNYEISDGMLRKRFFAIIRNEINIDDIQTIEIYNELKAGQIRINIASPDEDEYRLIFKSGEVMKIPSYYMNKRTSVGKYLAKKYKIKTKDTKKVKYLYG